MLSRRKLQLLLSVPIAQIGVTLLASSLTAQKPTTIQRPSSGAAVSGRYDAGPPSGNLSEEQRSALIPQSLLQLIHDGAVQKEIGLNSEQATKLESYFAQIDGDWWRARLLKPDENRLAIAKIEQAVRDELPAILKPEQIDRLKQLERRAQGARFVIHPDSIAALKLTQKQLTAIERDIIDSEKQSSELSKKAAADPNNEGLQKKIAELRVSEQKNVFAALETSQTPIVRELIGKDFNLSQVNRIYPMAPDLAPVPQWFNSKPLTLSELRGKVVVIHFYAFGCSNCHANFPHYAKWHKELTDKGVQVIGIQTPETPAERDPDKVMRAAQQASMTYPIAMDSAAKNWNNWGTTMWPTVYVVDKKGYIRQWWQGELNWQGATGDKSIEKMIDQLLSEKS